MLFTAPDSTTSHGEEHPYDRFFRFWVFGVMLPATAVAWHCTGGRILLSLAAALVLPLLAIAQGATGILKYRLYYADAPVPLSPSHGVVIVPKNSPRKSTAAAASESHIVGNTNERQQQQQQQHHHPPAAVGATIPLRKTPSYPLSLGCECGVGSQRPAAAFCEEAASAGTKRDGAAAAMLDGGDSRRPVRLLIIGDSLAIGVGQARQCTPIMPEVIAKTISRHLDGRTVYWTAHGSPGASTGWIVRELERGVTYLEKKPKEEEQQYQGEQSSEAATAAAAEVLQHPPPELEKSSSHSSSSCCETDDSSSDEYSLPDALNDTTATETRIVMKEQHKVWRERLAQHRKRFDPEALGPYDVVIVVTGSNDVKSEYFPFLLKGEDAKFRREAMERGGDYAKELRRVLQTLNRGMRSHLQSLRDSVEAATETVIELAEETIERMGSNGMSPGKGHDFGSSYREKLEARKEASSSQILSDNSDNLLEQEDDDREGDLPRNFPLVVLPGLPARGLPLFRKAPLRWLAVPALDIQDMHKRNVARSHPEKVLFVPPPSIADLATYENCTGEFWQQHCEEETVLALRDIRQKDCRRIEGEMRDYYEVKDPRRPTGKGLQMTANRPGWLSFFSRTAAPGTSIFSVDRIHPTDHGYDFWGRYIASAIVDEWRAHPHLEPPL